jgi:hypothetical protein
MHNGGAYGDGTTESGAGIRHKTQFQGHTKHGLHLKYMKVRGTTR